MKSSWKKMCDTLETFCAPFGVTIASETVERMRVLARDQRPFAIVVWWRKKRRRIGEACKPNGTVEIIPAPLVKEPEEYVRWHDYGRMLRGMIERGGHVLLQCQGVTGYHLHLCTRETWEADYQLIVPSYARPREGVVTTFHREKPKERKVSAWPLPVDRYGKPSDEEPNFGNPYRRRCPNHGFQRTGTAHRVMSYMGVLGVRP